ncbi:GNAT family N-acetyltransferase [Pseudalkalibacillus hwajinpoensis]|uniref:GNAT family N-acetyltransferase n=1 Tax=Guptibacillus hwajinpoensis TaxID=208199 RepID=UPI00325B2EC7
MRKAQAEDLSYSNWLNKICFQSTHELTGINESDTYTSFIVEEKTIKRGKIHIEPLGKQSWICGFAVEPEHQGKGIGAEALRTAISMELEQGQEIYLEVALVNEHAMNLYLNCGFQIIETQNYYELTR